MSHLLMLYIFLTTGLIASLALFLSLKREMRLSGAQNRKRIDEMLARVAEAHARPSDTLWVPPPAPRVGWNVNRRVQAMRMLRRNEHVSTIAAALGVTRQEVQLLIRVQTCGPVPAASQK